MAELCAEADPKTRLSAAKLILEVGMPPGHEDDAIQAPLDLRAMPPAERAIVLERRAKQLLELAALDRAASQGVEVIDEPTE